MAKKPQSFRLIDKKHENGRVEKTIVLFKNVRIEEETDLINFYLDRGYQPKYEVKKDSLKVDDMRKLLADDKETLAKFEEAYAKKITKDMTKEEKKEAGFFGACKVFNEWKKAKKELEKKKKEENKED